MATGKDRPGDTGSVEQTEAFDLAAMKDGGEGRVEIAQTGATPIEVPRPGAGQTLTVSVVAGRPLKLDFNAGDVKSREVVKDDLVLEFDNGGKIVLKEYMTAFGMLGDVRTTIIQPDGKHYAFTELLSPTAGPRTTERPAPGTQGDVVIIQKPPAGEKQTFKLTDEKPMALNFGFGQIAKSQVDGDGNLVLTFKDGAVLVLEGYSALKDNKSIGLYFAKGDKIALADLAPGAGPEDPGAEGGRLFTEFAPGGTLSGLGHLGPLGPLPFQLIPPPGPPGSPPGSPPPPPPPPPPGGEGPTYFIKGPECMIEEVDPSFTFGVTSLQLEAGQTRSVDIRVDFLAIQPGHGAAAFDDFVGGENFLFLAIQAAAANETGITVTDLGNGAVRVTFASNASTNQLTFDILAVDDGLDELIEDFRFVISNEQVTGGAAPGTIVVGPGTSFVDSQILDLDEFQVSISDAVGNEGDTLVFDVTLSNPSGEDIVLDLVAQPLTTVDTNPATPGVDFEAGNFQYSVDGGVTWIGAGGPNGTIVTIPAGSTAIKVRIDTFGDAVLEGDESFLLTVANKDQLDHCDVTNIVDGAGYIFDGKDEPKGPTYFIEGPECLIEEVDPTFTFGVSDLMLDAGQTRSIDIRVEFATVQAGHGVASFDDFVGGADFLIDGITDAIAGETGITVTDLGNGAVRVTFAANASTNQIAFDILAVEDGLDEPVEDFLFVLENEQVTGGAVPGTLVPGEGTSFVNSQILDPDEYQVTISDAVGFEGDQLVFDITLSNASDETITLDLAAQPLTTIDTNPATPGVDLENVNFEVSTDGGLTWQPAGGANGTSVTFDPGQTALKVRIETFTDGVQEGDESFMLTVANKDEIGHCDVTKIVEGAGYIFDTGDCTPPPPEWFVCGPPCLIEEVDPTYTVGISDLALDPGQTRSVDVKVEFLSLHTGHDAASFADLGGPNFLFDALADAAAGETGITVANLGNGSVRVTFAADASTTQLAFDLLPVADNIDEEVEDFRIVLENSTATNGAPAGVIVPGEGTSFVESHIVESDEYTVTIGNAQADEGDPLVFAVSLSNPHTDEPLTLDLEAVSRGATAGVDFEAFGFEYSTDGGTTWKDAGGPNGTSVTFEPGETELLVRIETFPDSLAEGREDFRLTVANQDELGLCDLSGVEDGKGVILDRAPDCEPPPPRCDPPPVCDPPVRHGWQNGQRSTGAAHAAFAALMGLPIVDEPTQGDDKGNATNWKDDGDRSGDHNGGGGQNWDRDGWNDDSDRNPRTNDDSSDRGNGDGHRGWNAGWSSDNDWNSDHDGANSRWGSDRHSDEGDRFKSNDDWGSGNNGTHGHDFVQQAGNTIPVIGDDDTVHEGTAGNDTLYAEAGETLRGGAGDDTLVAKAGFAEIAGGAGYDTFKFDDSGVLDLSTLSGKVTGIEKADITGTGNVELKLSFQDLLTMTDSGHQLTIMGDSGDKVSADLSGHSVAVTDMGAFTRYVIDGGAATLDIDNHVQKNIIGI